MSTQPIPLFTHEEFLDREVDSTFRHEYKQGRVEMMAGGSPNHALLQANAVRVFGNALEDRECRVYGEALMVHIAAANASTYPDAMVVCGELLYADRRKNVISNPLVIVEVLSPSTERYDRGEKFAVYQQLSTLQEYVLVAQNEPLVEVHRRTEQGDWVKTEFRGLECDVKLDSLDVTIPSRQLFAKVKWEVS